MARGVVHPATVEGELSWRLMLGDLPDTVFELDRDHRYRFVNAAGAAGLGCRPEDAIGRHLADFFPPEAADSMGAVADEGFRTGELQAGEQVLHIAGGRRWYEYRLAPLRDAGGEIASLIGFVRDNTRRRLAEQALREDVVRAQEQLRESERRLRSLLDGVRLLAVALDLHGRITYTNPYLFEVTGFGPEEAIGQEFQMFIADDGQTARAFEAFRRTGVVEPFIENRMVTGRGDFRTVRWFNTGVRDDTGAIVGWISLGEDVTNLRCVEQERDRLTAAVEQAAEAVIMTDLTGTIVYVNPAFERITGYGRTDVVGQNPRVLKSGEQSPAFYQRLWQTLRQGDVWSGRFVNRCRNGSSYVADAVISPIRDADGRVVNYVGIQRDVTREQELDDALRQSQKMEAVGQLTGGMAHDFNNLLTVILGSAALVRADLGSDVGAAASYLEDLEGAARRGSEMIRKLLAFSRRGRLAMEVVDLAQLSVEVSGTLRRLLPESIEIRIASGEVVPRVRADARAVEQMLMNLATNARDAMPNGGRLTIGVGTTVFGEEDSRSVHGFERAGRYTAVSVTDTGFGMSRETLARVFEPFFTTKPPGSGTGLGMAMVYGLMKQHRGFVTVYSEPGQGTTVRLYFPADYAAVQAGPSPFTPAGSSPGNGETVLIVEDEPDLRRIASRILERHGYRVLTASDGQDALRMLDAERGGVDVVLSDMIMPNMGGADLLAALRCRGAPVRFILSSGYAAGDVRAREGVGHQVPIVEKPWTAESLVAAVRGALDAPAEPAS
jgi:two-component system NtrC family sensor kinase